MFDKVPIVSPSKYHDKIYIQIKVEDVVECLLFGMYDNVLYMTCDN